MGTTYFPLSSIHVMSLFVLFILFLSGKNGRSFVLFNNSFRYSMSTLSIAPQSSVSSELFMTSSLQSFGCIHSNLPTGNLLIIAYPYKLFASKYIKYDERIFFVTIFHVFIISTCVFNYCLIHAASNSFFKYNNIFMSVNNCNFILVFFKHTCHPNPGADTKCAGSS